MEKCQPHSTWLEIDLNAIENNIRWIARYTGVQVMAIVKANAYGHGAMPVARAALRAGASWLGVARVSEALALRQSGLDCPILAMGYASHEYLAEAIAQRISLTVWDRAQVEAISAAAAKVGPPARIHLKVDTGMSRLGVQPEEALELARQITSVEGIVLEGMFTHFARADERDNDLTEIQERAFRYVLETFQSSGLTPPLIHAANSAAILTRPDAHFSLVRAGIAMYGLHPSAECPLPSDFRPALAWKSVLSQVKVLPAGRGVSYGHEYVTTAEECVGTVPVGYADGFRRTAGNLVLVNGRRAPVIGRVCMDQLSVHLNAVPGAQVGDEVVLIGQQGGESISAEEVALRWGTINYEVVCAIAARVPRLYF